MSSRYAEAHANIQGPGDARPTALQIVKDEAAEGTLKGQVIVITGTSSGIGIETVRALAATGATLVLTARDMPKAEKALEGIFDPATMEMVKMDNGSLASVRTAGAYIRSKYPKIHVLVENAGIMAIPDLRLTEDGFELQFGTNHLSHFLLFKLLESALLANATPENPSRVVVLASSGHNSHGLLPSDNYNFEKGKYNDFVAYGQSKTANIYMANEVERRYGSQNLHATSIHPGVVYTNLVRHMTPEALGGMKDVRNEMKSVEQGAATSVWAAIGKEWKNKGGKFLSDVSVPGPFQEGSDPITGHGYAPWAYDEAEARRLWKDSLKLVGLPTEE